MNINELEDDKIELEDQFILRLPPPEAEYIRNLLRNKPKKIKKRLKLDLDPDIKTAQIFIKKKQIEGRLRKLPTIIESYKIQNGSSIMVKTADICQIIDCIDKNGNCEVAHGITAPLKNVKKKRFRKCLANKDEAAINVQKELFYLLQADLEAVGSKFEIINDTSSKTCHKTEIEIFGNVVTDSEASDSNNED